jgi:tRNA 2-thiouridine synthesizing protein A
MKTVTVGEKEIEVTEVINAKNLFCPMPLLKTKKELVKLVEGQIIQVDVTDPNSQKDIVGWCKRSENDYLGEKIMTDFISVFIRKK